MQNTGKYITFYQGGPIDHGTHGTGTVAKSSVEIEYNAACTAGMSWMLIREFLNKDPYIVPEGAPLIILDTKYDVCIAKDGKDTKRTRQVSRKMNLARNGEKCKMHKMYWCEGGLQLEEIATNNVGGHDLTPRIKYIMVRLDN